MNGNEPDRLAVGCAVLVMVIAGASFVVTAVLWWLSHGRTIG